MSLTQKIALTTSETTEGDDGHVSVVPPPVPPLKLSPFEERLRVMTNSAACVFGLSVGNDLGLFEVLSRFEKPASSTAIADEAKLNDRYVREWLNLMVVSDILTATTDQEGDEDLYFLPADRREAILGEDAATSSLFFTCVAPAYFPLLECFKEGGGLPYSIYKDFHCAMNALSTIVHEGILLPVFVPSVPGLEERLKKGIYACDLGCGQGAPSIILASKFPNSQFYGYDISREAIEVARSSAAAKGLTNMTFEVRDCTSLGDDCPKFDYITAFNAVHDMPRPDLCLSEVHRVLRSDGVFSLVESIASTNPQNNIDFPYAISSSALSLAHCLPVSMHTPGSMGLGMMWGWENVTKMLRSAGFSYINLQTIGDIGFGWHFVTAKAAKYLWSQGSCNT